MKVIAGLGNPGQEYRGTPHNVGFDVVDHLCERFGVGLKRAKRFQADIGDGRYRGERVLFVQPQTFMNRSGLALSAIMSYYRVSRRDLVVVYDDADLSPGCIRVRPGGSSGGHRGIVSIEEQFGDGDFARVRIGIGRGIGRGSLVSHVLGGFREEDAGPVKRAVEVASEAALCVVSDGVVRAMNRFNGWSAQKEKEENEAEVPEDQVTDANEERSERC